MNSTALITTMQRFVLATKKSWIAYDWAADKWNTLAEFELFGHVQ